MTIYCGICKDAPGAACACTGLRLAVQVSTVRRTLKLHAGEHRAITDADLASYAATSAAADRKLWAVSKADGRAMNITRSRFDSLPADVRGIYELFSSVVLARAFALKVRASVRGMN